MSSITFEYNTHILGSIVRVVTGAFGSITHSVHDHLARKAAERRLASLDDRLLEDIGINRGEIHSRVWSGRTL